MLEEQPINKKSIILHVTVEEKKLLEKIVFVGNKAISKKQILEKIKLDKLPTIDEDTLIRVTKSIKKIYKEKNYHMVTIKPRLLINPETPDKATAHFTIHEGSKSMITRVFFRGNKIIPSRKLMSVIFTRERWLLGFVSDAGKYDEQQLDMDKHRIEYFYRDNGYLLAKVLESNVAFSENKKQVHVTFYLTEGPQFKVGKVRAYGDEFFTEKELLERADLEKGEPFSQKKIRVAMQRLKNLWGQKGYIYADVYPQIKPNEEDKTVDISFHVERGNKMYVNRINVTGNKYTRDKVIRREIIFEEGDLLTSQTLNDSKDNVEYLGFFERGGVNWKIHRITDELADLELNVKEAKTGHGNLGISYGSTRDSATRSLKVMLEVGKRNLFGMGNDVNFLLQADRHKFRRFQFNFFDPYIFDTNISGAFNFYVNREDYEQWKTLNKTPKEKIVGGNINIGFMLPSIDKRLKVLLEAGVNSIDNNKLTATGIHRSVLQPVVDRVFESGTLSWLAANIIKDTRNHRIYPNKGYKLSLNSKWAPTFFNNQFSLFKSELDLSWYTALIGKDSLVLALHTRGGIVRRLTSKKDIPYKELFHMGGQNTVRGFLWGSIGPAFGREPIGARNMVQFNAELIFPLMTDYSMKAHVFYDAGAGWSTQKHDITRKDLIIRDKFNLRHSIGFGINLVYPQAVKIDWGYKLDRNREAKESPFEWHISMNVPW
jgi:outer membrane protein insertion porin family